ncbi:thiamine phosphate synthase [Pseudodesulfovibrio senegalensis]|uniref:Thiamine-phosphate synthase n=1 Tax=Pseudodesulfovibrio senegalensis TaxID=1721087 RepID=A0A6N6N2F6_9BACT|nr:thiamine phosphate synthase [Pseudodesulfovibrio senegalensis]KAB1441622.1 thiamine phosphate synthase [Pseudodesulfovibrio senegalensis]
MTRDWRTNFDCSLYLVTDSGMCSAMGLERLVTEAVAGGVTMVQLREKHASTREFLDKARALQAILQPQGVPLLINDRVDIALAVNAAGVHLGQSDMPCHVARQLLGPGAIIGLTVDTDEQAVATESMDADYLGVGPVFETSTKPDHSPVLGVDGFTRRRALSSRPCVAIGSVRAEHAHTLLDAGADGLAVVSALCAAGDPRQAARELREAVESFRG